MSSDRPLIAATGSHKSYGGKLVLGGIDLTVTEGTVFALPGPNGAGKTTAVHISSTLVGAGGGEVRVADHDGAHWPDAVRDAIGVTGQFWRPTACSPARRPGAHGRQAPPPPFHLNTVQVAAGGRGRPGGVRDEKPEGASDVTRAGGCRGAHP